MTSRDPTFTPHFFRATSLIGFYKVALCLGESRRGEDFVRECDQRRHVRRLVPGADQSESGIGRVAGIMGTPRGGLCARQVASRFRNPKSVRVS